MINYDLLSYDELGEIILETEPTPITADTITINRMLAKGPAERTPFWNGLFNEWKEKGILID